MADYIDVQYATLLASRFERYRVVHRNPLKINFRCTLCGDSKKSKTKSRAWIVEVPKTGHLHFTCFNCGASESFSKFAQQIDPNLYNEYVTERYINTSRDTKPNTDEKLKTAPPKFDKNPLATIKKMSQLKHDHPAKEYIINRQIPSNQHYRLYYAPKFMTWINSIIPNKFENVNKDEPRLIMPLIDRDGFVFGVSARAFNPKSLRYITIMFRDNPKIFGLDVVDFDKKYFVTEGQLDAMFLSNSVAMVGADVNFSGLKKLENAIFVFDNEYRNVEIVKRMEKAINKGYKVCLWPKNIAEKDINDMHLAGRKNIEQIILDNTFSGLQGQLQLSKLKSC
jgi:transcription elongation factor Elf1